MTGPHGQRGRNIDLTLHDLPAGLVNGILRAVAQRLHQLAVAVRHELCPDAQQGRDQSGSEHIAPVIVHPILQPGRTRSIGTGLAIEQDRAATGQDQAIPGKQHAVLPGRDLAVIFADEAGALGDQQHASGRTVVDILRHLGGNLPWKVGLDAGEKRGGDYAACLHHIG